MAKFIIISIKLPLTCLKSGETLSNSTVQRTTALEVTFVFNKMETKLQ